MDDAQRVAQLVRLIGPIPDGMTGDDLLLLFSSVRLAMDRARGEA